MDTMVGSDFEAGLEAMKTAAEADAKKADARQGDLAWPAM